MFLSSRRYISRKYSKRFFEREEGVIVRERQNKSNRLENGIVNFVKNGTSFSKMLKQWQETVRNMK